MSKRKNNAVKSPSVVVHTSPHGPLPEGNIIYPELVRPQTRLESLSRTVRFLIPSFAPPSTSPTPPSLLPSSSTTAAVPAAHRRSSYGSYASTAADESSNVPDQSNRVNSVSWSAWASLHTCTLLLVAYSNSGFHIWDFTSLDTVKEVLHLPSIGPVISAAILSPRSTRKHPVLFLLTGTNDNATLCIYSLTSHSFLKRISIPNARTVQANDRFVCIGVGVDGETSKDSPSAIHILSSSSSYMHLYTLPTSSISPHTLSSPIFTLSSSRLLAYASSEPPVHLQSSSRTPPSSSSYPPSNSFTPLQSRSPTSNSTSNFATGLSAVGSTVLTGAMRLGTGVLEGVKMGISAAGYGDTTMTTARVDEERDAEVRRSVSRSAPTHVSPLAARGHARRASAQVRSALFGGHGTLHRNGSTIDAGEWVTVVDLQPLLDRVASKGMGMEGQDEPITIHPALSPSSSFLVTSPPLTRLAHPSTSVESNSNARAPEVVVEFPYTSSATIKPDPYHNHHARSSPSKYGSPLSGARLSSSHSAAAANSTTPASKAVVSMTWSPGGQMLAVGGADGASVRVFAISRGRRVGGGGLVDSERKGEASLVYELLRGVTPASILDIRWSNNGLWSGFVSDKGTLHVYALNPHGGETDGTSHVYGRVINPAKRPLPVARVQALARLRQPLFGMDQDDLSTQQGLPPPAHASREGGTTSGFPIFIFLPNNTSRSSSRLPAPPEQRSPPTSLLNLNNDSGSTNAEEDPPSNGFNDALIFLPEEGRAVLWRCTLKPFSSSHTPGTKSPVGSRRIEPSTSIVGDSPASPVHPSGLPSSLPIGGVGGGVLSGVARLARLGDGGLTAALTRSSIKLAAGAAVIASWDLRRGVSWPAIKSGFWAEKSAPTDEASRRSYVSHAELTTFHFKSTAVPRPIYLSHQFHFSSLMNDYQALVRRLILDPPTYPVAMRKESVVVRGGDDLLSLHPRDSRTSLPGDFDSDANFLGAGTNMGPLDLTDSPLLGGHLGLPMEGVPLSSSLASTNITSLSSQSRSGRRIVGKSFDDGLSSAMESRLQLDASYSPSGSSSDVASPGRVIPMLPNGRPGSSGSGVSAGLDAVMRSTTRVGKEVWSGLGNVRSPRLVPTKRSSASGDMLKFDEEDEMFIVDGLEEGPGNDGVDPMVAADGLGTRREDSLATIGPGIGIRYPLIGMADSGLTVLGPPPASTPASQPGEEGTWVEQPEVYAQAVEEDARFDDVTKVLEEEREEREERRARQGVGASPTAMSSSIVSESAKGKRKAGKKKRR